MREKDVKECEFDNPESCYHLTRAVHENSIAETGLGDDIGIRSTDGAGHEKTSKVFFAKSLKGTLIFLNRNLNIFYQAAKQNNFANYRNAISDDSPELYEQIFNEKVHDNMSEEELTEAALALGKLYLERGIYYKLDLKYCTREEFESMSARQQDEIDYFSDDINEERPDEHPEINNMHTRTGRGIAPEQMILMTANGSKSALDIAISMSEVYKALNPGEALPVLEYRRGGKDRPLLELLVEKVKEERANKTEEKNVSQDSNFISALKSKTYSDEEAIRNENGREKEIKGKLGNNHIEHNI